MKKVLVQIDTMFDYRSQKVDEIAKFIKTFEGTPAFWYFLSRMMASNSILINKLESLTERVEELERTNDSLREAMKGKNEYGF